MLLCAHVRRGFAGGVEAEGCLLRAQGPGFGSVQGRLKGLLWGLQVAEDAGMSGLHSRFAGRRETRTRMGGRDAIARRDGCRGRGVGGRGLPLGVARGELGGGVAGTAGEQAGEESGEAEGGKFQQAAGDAGGVKDGHKRRSRGAGTADLSAGAGGNAMGSRGAGQSLVWGVTG